MSVSYGLSSQTITTQLISTGITTRVFVPSNSTLGLIWTARVFNDSLWLATNTPVGFNAGVILNPVLALDVNERGVDPAPNTQAGFVSFLINSTLTPTPRIGLASCPT
jgi:hypothetical protein